MSLNSILSGAKKVALGALVAGAMSLGYSSPTTAGINAVNRGGPAYPEVVKGYTQFEAIPITGDMTPNYPDLDFKVSVCDEDGNEKILYVTEEGDRTNLRLLRRVERKLENAFQNQDVVRIGGYYSETVFPPGHYSSNDIHGEMALDYIGFFNPTTGQEEIFFTDPPNDEFYNDAEDFILFKLYSPGHSIRHIYYPTAIIGNPFHPSWDIDGDGIPNFYDPNPRIPNWTSWDDWNFNGIPDWYDPFYMGNYNYWHHWDWGGHVNIWADWYDVNHFHHHRDHHNYYNMIEHGRDAIGRDDPRWNLQHSERDQRRHTIDRNLKDSDQRVRTREDARDNIRRDVIRDQRNIRPETLDDRVRHYDTSPRGSQRQGGLGEQREYVPPQRQGADKPGVSREERKYNNNENPYRNPSRDTYRAPEVRRNEPAPRRDDSRQQEERQRQENQRQEIQRKENEGRPQEQYTPRYQPRESPREQQRQEIKPSPQREAPAQRQAPERKKSDDSKKKESPKPSQNNKQTPRKR